MSLTGVWCCPAEANGKNEAPQRKQEAQLTILPLQHSKVAAHPTANNICFRMTRSTFQAVSPAFQGPIEVLSALLTRRLRLMGAAAAAQVVHFVRHGEGYHNIGVVNEDAHLTEAGWRQADALKKHIAGLTPALDIEVGASPRPACQFKDHPLCSPVAHQEWRAPAPRPLFTLRWAPRSALRAAPKAAPLLAKRGARAPR